MNQTEPSLKIHPEQKLSVLQKLFRLFNRQERWEIVIVFFASLFTALVQSTSVISVMPFINIVMNLQTMKSEPWIQRIYELGRFSSDQSFILFMGIAVIFLLVLSSVLSSLTSWIKHRFVLKRNYQLSLRLLTKYLNKPYEYFLEKNSSELGKNILNEVNNLGNQYLTNLIELIISSLLFIFMLATLFVINFKITLIIVAFFTLTYGGMTIVFRLRLIKQGELVVQFNKLRFKAATEALTSIKITKAFNLEPFFIKRFSKTAEKYSNYQLFARLIGDIPNYLLEGLVFATIIVVVLFIVKQDYDLPSLIPTISVYALAGYRISPALNKIFKAATTMIHNQPVLDKVYYDLFDEDYEPQAHEPEKPVTEGESLPENLSFQEQLELKSVSFSYRNSRTIIDQLSIQIPKNSVVGFAGTTGAGKTTLIDLFLGLLRPTTGEFLVDGTVINDTNAKSWRNIVSYVPQDIFLIDDTIRSNIAFGVPEKNIDDEKVHRVARLAAIDDFIEQQMANGYDTVVGERGVRLSGGQRQRIGLARALYRDPEVLILDEATSALDGTTEERVLKGIHQESSVKTILIIAHRLNTLRVCDQIYLLENGRIVDQGSYEQMCEYNATFKQMAMGKGVDFE
ncbi:MAG: ABC transporter ATP-binding protein [Clostridia bacterium]|nr:ABC transporter ATP-binding protein [Clostridia bacterium]